MTGPKLGMRPYIMFEKQLSAYNFSKAGPQNVSNVWFKKVTYWVPFFNK